MPGWCSSAARAAPTSPPAPTSTSGGSPPWPPGTEAEPVRALLAWVERLAAGDPAAGPLAALPPSERFGAPSSTVLQPGPVHTGLCTDPEETLARLFGELVG